MRYTCTCVAFLFLCNLAFSQQNKVSFVSGDSVLSFSLTRATNAVDINISVASSDQLEYIMIEKSADPILGFRQCRYVEYAPTKNNDAWKFATRDIYPLTAQQNVYYRVKTISKEGFCRTYPAVCLPGLLEKSPTVGL